jgi:hypothetical protein
MLETTKEPKKVTRLSVVSCQEDDERIEPRLLIKYVVSMTGDCDQALLTVHTTRLYLR